jgi:prolyl oligopeptidase
MNPSSSFRVPSARAVPLLAALLLTFAACGSNPSSSSPVVPTGPDGPPETRTADVVETIHGVEVADPYRWLEDQDAPETRRWIDRQNAYTDSRLDDLPGRDALREQVAAVLQTDTVGIPRVRAGRYFYEKRLADQDLGVIYMRDGRDGEDRVLLDPHGLSEDHSVSVDLQEISDDGRIVAYSVRDGGQDEVEIRFLDVDRDRELADRLPKGRYYGLEMTPDSAAGDLHLFYARHSAEGPRIYEYETGRGERVIFGDGHGPGELMFPILSPDGRWLALNVSFGSAGDRSDLYLMDLEAGRSAVPVAVDKGARFRGAVLDGRVVMETNWKAPNNRVLVAPATAPAEANWDEIVPERRRAVLDDVTAVAGRLYLRYLRDVSFRVEAVDLEGRKMEGLEVEKLGSVFGPVGTWESPELFYGVASFHVPTTVYRYDAESGERWEWDRVELPVDTRDFEVQQRFFVSEDGTRVPMFLVHPRGIELDGSHPTLLTGYGGFNLSLTPRFSATTALWVSRGGVYAVANLRGGGEYGEEWHQAGMLERKQNVFDDFAAAAEFLVSEGFTSPDKLAVQGGSNGGLLVGALVTQRPELVEAAIISYPLLDMIRYQQFLVARFWVPEYGSSEDPEQFPYLLAYSPYHNVEDGAAYPATLLLTGDNDTRVDPLHARKMAARLQAAQGADAPVLLRYHTSAGHVGGQPVADQIEDMTDMLSFLEWQLKD